MPSGVSYVMTNRRAIVGRAARDVRRAPDPPGVAATPQRLLAALRAAAPAGVSDPTVVVLTPGVYNGAYFEHALLARTMGVELVEGRDLVCRRGRVMMRTTQRPRAGARDLPPRRRRVPRPGALPRRLAARLPGLINAARAGNVTIANAVGNGVADDKLRLHLRARPRSATTSPRSRSCATSTPGGWATPTHREEVLDRLDELVLKPVDGSGGKGIVIGPRRDRGRARRAARQGARRPAGLDRPAGGPAVDRADVRRRTASGRGTSTCGRSRSTTATRVGAARRADPRRARRGRADRQLLAAAAAPRTPGCWPAPPTRRPSRTTRPTADARSPAGAHQHDPRRWTIRRGRGSSRQQQQQQQPRRRALDAEPDRRVAVLDRPLRRARRGHRPHPRRADPAAARGPAASTSGRPASSCSRSWASRTYDRHAEPLDDPRPAGLRPRVADLDRRGASAPPARAPAGPARPCPPTCGRPSTPRTGAIPADRSASMRPPDMLPWVRDRAALINGIADATMTRDEGWQFLMLGRCIERADMTSRLCRTAALASGAAGRRGPRTLRACGAYEAFLRTYRGIETDRAGRGVPAARPAVPALGRVRARPRPSSAWTSSRRRASGPGSRTRRSGCSAGPAPSWSTARSTTLVADLPVEMERLQRTCAAATEAVSRRYFAGSEDRLRRGRGGCRCCEHAAADQCTPPATSYRRARSRRTTRPG